ncbi:cytochrome-c oxidase, cbb3-type subunit III [Rhodoferax ferrireducens]|uniref:cytochrome-c oxidase, cbb3-type subunit III n=1 Tax=Rhodoferax ferrireducens TaxID=192843 RepID=UPI00298DCAAC|nr:cytochrome-c oxidase, cbb3-type subunit III [Rhodoferax ferrireducens]WPC68783.1 cytochrome-c oxidase, cbb3-type subunit III [Rhodoferax ferrireducens]
MSDFTSNFWSIYVAGITIVSIVACLLLLILTGKSKGMSASDNTTGHVWDGDLREMNNPLPRWWAWLFVITIVFSFVYLALYPGLGTYGGKLGWTSVGQHQTEVDKGNAEVAPLYAKFSAMKPEDVAKDAQAMAIGERLFMNNCAQCHGSDARGNKGFPNLTDNDWLGGGTPEIIKADITKGRIAVMPPMAAAVGTAEDVKNLAQYVLSLSGSPHDSVQAALGKEKFAVCAACHGIDGKGNQTLGSANLTDNIWLHGYGEAAIVAMINEGKTNQMPAQADKLTEAQVHVLASYVWGLSNKGGIAAQ